MTPFILALLIGALPVTLMFAWAYADEWLADRADRERRAEQDREVSAEWLAVLAATEPTPIYDRLVCEQIEREEWSA